MILSERVLIFSSGLAMCAQPVISLETKKSGMWRELASVCVCVCVLPYCSVCMCFVLRESLCCLSGITCV